MRRRPRLATSAVTLVTSAFLVALFAPATSLPAAAAAAPAAPSPNAIPGSKVFVMAGAPGPTSSIAAPPAASASLPNGARAALAASASAQITYAASVPSGYKPAIQAAVNIWMGLLSSTVPIAIQVSGQALGAGFLAGSGPPYIYKDFPGAPVAGTYYPPALADAITGTDIKDHASSPYDDVIVINTSGTQWYFGTDGNTPSTSYDLESVVLHELTHGWGFLGTTDVPSPGQGAAGTWGIPDNPKFPTVNLSPDIYDLQVQDGSGRKVVNNPVYPSGSTPLGNALQGAVGGIFFNSSSSGSVKLFSPSTWLPGSSYSHLDENTYPRGSANSLVTPYLGGGESVHTPGPLTLCMLEALGWSTPENCTPPPPTTTSGFSWFADGSTSKTVSSGSVISAYATGLQSNAQYKLVTGLDGGVNQPCMWDDVAVNASVRTASFKGFIPTTAGVVNRSPGRYQVCFEQQQASGTVRVATPLTLTVT